jgi:D-alanine transaminase
MIYLNGDWMPIEKAMVPVLDRGFIFGDGIYEFIPVYGRKPFRAARHFARLKRSLGEIGIRNPHTDAEWNALLAEIIAKQSFADQGVYFQVTRGVAARDHAFPKDAKPTVYMMSNPLVTPSAAQLAGGMACVTAVDNRWHRCDIKSISLLGNVLMRQLAAEHGAIETVMFRDGFLTEASSSNVFVVKNGTVQAPLKDNLMLHGITLDEVIDLTRAAGLPLELRPITAAEVWTADELWLSSSSKEVVAITKLDGKPVGAAAHLGKPGPMFAKIRAAYDQAKIESAKA